MIPVHIKENSLRAKLAAKWLGTNRVAIVMRQTIYLHNCSAPQFVENRRWLLHELEHVAQFRQYGTGNFMLRYIAEYLRRGYHHNRYEMAARAAETDNQLPTKYQILKNII